MGTYYVKGSNLEKSFTKEFLTLKNAMRYYKICKESGQWNYLIISDRYEGDE